MDQTDIVTVCETWDLYINSLQNTQGINNIKWEKKNARKMLKKNKHEE